MDKLGELMQAIEKDHVDWMKSILQNREYKDKDKLYYNLLLKYCMRHNSFACFKSLLGIADRGNVQESILPSSFRHDIKFLRQLLQDGYKVDGRFEQATNLHAVIMQSKELPERESPESPQYMAENLKEFLQVMLENGARNYPQTIVKNKQEGWPIQRLIAMLPAPMTSPPKTYSVRRFYQIVFECSEILLKGMKKEKDDYDAAAAIILKRQGPSPFPPVSLNTSATMFCMEELCQSWSTIVRFALDPSCQHQDHVQTALNLCCDLAELLLGKYGLNLDQRSWSGFFFNIIGCLHAMNSCGKLDAEFTQYINRFCKLFFIYGAKPNMIWLEIADTILRYKPKYLLDLVPCSVTLLDNHTVYDHMCIKFGVRNEAKTLVVRSLLELCRYELYRLVPNRKMAEYKDKLPLPTLLKQYLIFQ